MPSLSTKNSNGRINNFDIRMLNRAIKMAEESPFHQFKTGCVITYRGHILSMAHNVEKTSPAQKKYNRYRHFNHQSQVAHKTHAEILALSKIPYAVGKEINWNRVHVYVARIAPGLKGGIGYSRPCPSCLAALKDVGIQHVFYTTNDGGMCYEKVNINNRKEN